MDIPESVIEKATAASIRTRGVQNAHKTSDELHKTYAHAVLSAVLVEVPCPTCQGTGCVEGWPLYGHVISRPMTASELNPPPMKPCTAPGCAGTGKLLVVERTEPPSPPNPAPVPPGQPDPLLGGSTDTRGTDPGGGTMIRERR